MTPTRLNLLCAVIALLGSVLMVFAQTPSAFLWFAASTVWLAIAIIRRNDAEAVVSPARRIARRMSRLLLFS